MFIQTKSPKITGVATITILYTMGFLGSALSGKDYSALPHLGAQLALMIFVFIAHKRIHYALPLLWHLSILGFLNLAGGIITIPSLGSSEQLPCLLNDAWFYHEWLSYSTFVHIYGFAVITWVNWQTLCNIIHSRYQRRLIPSSGLLLLVISSAVGYGAIAELLIHLTDTCFNPELAVNYTDICRSMSANVLGATLISFVIKLRNL